MIYDLPVTVEVCGVTYDVRSDYRAVLDICLALEDPELNESDKVEVALRIFYPAFAQMPPESYVTAIQRCFWFISCGDEGQNRPAPKLMDWEQDFKYLVAPINRVIGAEIRGIPYLHWWTFIGGYHEIGGECLFAQIIYIRNALAHGKKLDKASREWYRNNRDLVDIRQDYSTAETEILKQWGGV